MLAQTCAVALTPLRALAHSDSAQDDLLGWVDLRIGTGGHGHCFPGAAVPFGAVQLSPDTFNDGWDWCSGYHDTDLTIMGFSHTHLSGTGIGDLLDFLIMPGTGAVKLQPGPRSSPDEGYRSRFTRADEIAEPGFYQVFLADPAVKVELTATERTGLHRYTFPESDDAWLIVDLSHSYESNGHSTVSSAELEVVSGNTIAGGHVTRAWAKNRHCYFSLQVSRPPERVELYSDDQPIADTRATGTNLKAVLHFRTHANDQILVRVGISGVSTQGAERNLRAEQPAWNFEITRRAAQKMWREQLSRVRADISNSDQKRIFYTSLYHLSLGPTLFDDVDGQYRGMDGAIHTLPAGQRNYTTFSLWDTFRAAHPSYTIFQQDRVSDFANTLIRMAVQSPAGMPVWPLQGSETGTMTGYHSASVIAEAIHKGFPAIDIEAAYRCMMKRAMLDDYRGLGLYREMGYIPADREPEAVSKTFEYCYADWAIAHVARTFGKSDDAAFLKARSKNYRQYFNPEKQFMQPKLADGSWAEPFNPIELGHESRWHDYTESNAWQTTFGSLHDPAGTIELFGGREQFLRKLDLLFSVPSTLPPDAPPDIAGMVGQYAHGNEPSHHIAYLYVYGGAPWRTQARVRSLLDSMYRRSPDGIAGNEDVGQMSAWFVLSALGFYPVDPVSGNYILGSPLIDKAEIRVGNGRLVIEVKRNSFKNVFVQSFELNGIRQQRAWFNHTDITNGGHIVLTMGPKPNRNFGSAESNVPPSFEIGNEVDQPL